MGSVPVIVLVGPTATGKTEISIQLAKRIPAEIVCCDSMQVYNGMDIGTSKPSQDLRRGVPHYMVDIVSPTCDFNVALYCKMAQQIIEQIVKRGKIPIVVGGSGLYVNCLLDGIFEGVGCDEKFRRKLKLIVQKKGAGYLYNRLKRVDPDSASKIHSNDLRRVMRALEVYEKMKMPISTLKSEAEGIKQKYKILMFGLIKERNSLYSLIEKRVDEMLERGLLKEVKNLDSSLGKSASQALGYKEVLKYLKGECNLQETKELIKRNTRRFAKRQIAWFKRDKRIKWIEVDKKRNASEVVDQILQNIKL